MATTWGSKNAEDLYRLATRMANFDAGELMTEIHRRTAKSKAEKVNERTVEAAMQTVFERHAEEATERGK